MTNSTTSSTAKKCLVIGAGLSGLTLAYRLQKAGLTVSVWEKENRTGGAVGSGRQDGILWESGPNSGMDTSPAIGDLLADLKITELRVNANKIADRRFIVKNKQLHPLPMSGGAFFSTPLFSLSTKLGLMREPFIPRSSPEVDESVAGFVRRRLGTEFLDYAIEPFVSGIFAGDPETLSVQAAFPKLFALEQRYGGLIRGLILGARERKRRAEKSKNNAKSFAFKDGMQTLTDTLTKALADVKTGVTVHAVARQENGSWCATATRAGESLDETFDVVAIATPTEAAAALLQPFASNEAVSALNAITYAPVSILVSAWRRETIPHPLDGFGYLIPKVEHTATLGTLFSSAMFPYRADADHAVLTTFVGGMRHPELPGKSDDDLKTMESDDLRALLGIKTPPLWTRISRHPRAIPQYTFGHLDRVARVEAVKKSHPGIFFCANWRGGIAFSDCIKNGYAVAEEIAGFLR
ncbi:MAG: protoporphyrinogen oxidase [Burkholderiales bacterium]|jgi:oxygen-dependent protoporphyrinogen oxidase|nr:protoporphyrinogen oxidase [Burkholderiales bacterium]